LNKEFPVLLNRTIEKISQYINSDKEDVVLIENASSGFNAVLRSFRFEKGDKVLVTSIGYSAVLSTLKLIRKQSGIEIVTVHIPIPTNENEIIQRIQREIMNNKIKFCILDHISSFPTMVLPIERLIPLLRQYNIKTLIGKILSIKN
jgi:isopenicillin-N epimerase